MIEYNQFQLLSIHFMKNLNYNNFKNIIITNLKENYAYKYDDKLGYFIAGNKNEICSDLINNRVMDIEAIYDEL